MTDDGPRHVLLSAEQRTLLKALIRKEARSLGHEEGMGPSQWPKQHIRRLMKLRTIIRKLEVPDNYRAG